MCAGSGESEKGVERAGRALKKKLAPLAEDTDRISSRGVMPEELPTTRKVLLKMKKKRPRRGLFLELSALRPAAHPSWTG
ncbi:hypothetical protein GCM10027399_04260 [Curvibacter fontanus]